MMWRGRLRLGVRPSGEATSYCSSRGRDWASCMGRGRAAGGQGGAKGGRRGRSGTELSTRGGEEGERGGKVSMAEGRGLGKLQGGGGSQAVAGRSP